MGKLSRTKGRRLEQEVVLLLKPLFPEVKRNWSAQMEARSGRDLTGTPGFCFQIKGGACPPWIKGWQEAKEAVRGKEIPVCLSKRDREDWFIHMTLEDFMRLVGRER